MLRQKIQMVKEPNDPNFHSIPVKLTTTLRNDQFLRCDTGPGEDRILIFASDELLVDGTFKVVPEIFYQLYIIHGVFRDHVIPLVFALLRQKTAETYKDLIDEIIIIAPRWSPRTIMPDFEQSSIAPFKAAFPTVLLSGCYFHSRQSIDRKLRALGHQQEYETNADIAHNIHKIAALTFSDEKSVINGFERLSINLTSEFEDILDYFEGTDIAEAYHRRICAVFQCTHSILWIFFEKLISEENNSRADIFQVCANQQPTKRKLNERPERRSLNLLSNHHQDISVQMNTITYNISLQ
ncbi:unnamed protein product [Adineta ricciae]|uniref:MULE transposase domain-containing protein n=1 Tax=Adineta ricciae TaxID=249248 RepID=A0A815SJP2_ADIRI|nr:unnamed protein product [Adineta ricciae]CAF1490680.1 unnamed protein product [Adineta ricciae]